MIRELLIKGFDVDSIKLATGGSRQYILKLRKRLTVWMRKNLLTGQVVEFHGKPITFIEYKRTTFTYLNAHSKIEAADLEDLFLIKIELKDQK